jgi:hypothetical protein
MESGLHLPSQSPLVKWDDAASGVDCELPRNSQHQSLLAFR